MEELERVAHAEDDESHAVFTSTLEHTLNILRPFIRKPQFTDEEKDKVSRHDSVDDITNRFSKLEIEELADQEVDNAAVAVVEKSPATPRITYVVDNGEHERLLAMCCLLMDYNCVKEFIRSNWHENLLGRTVDLITTISTTQAAFQLLRSAVHHLTTQFPELSSMEAFSLNLIRRCNGVVRSASSKVELGNSRSCIQIPTSLAQFSCLKTYSLIWRVLDGYFVDDCFNRYILMEEMVEEGFLANASCPALESLHNALEDIASMQEAKIRQDPPPMDNFTQLWRDYFQALYGDDFYENDFTRKMNEKRPDLSVEIVLCTDIYLDVQDLIPAADPNLIPDDYKRNWSSKNYRESSDQSDHGDIMNRLRQPPFTSKHIRQGLNSFLRNESETTTAVRDGS